MGGPSVREHHGCEHDDPLVEEEHPPLPQRIASSALYAQALTALMQGHRPSTLGGCSTGNAAALGRWSWQRQDVRAERGLPNAGSIPQHTRTPPSPGAEK